MLRLTFVFNGIHLEAARRLRCSHATEAAGRPPRLELLLYERRRTIPGARDRLLWPLRLPITAPVMAAMAVLGHLGLVREVWLSHLRDAGRALRHLVAGGPALLLLDDGLDQYRATPRALKPESFPAGTPLALFSDHTHGRAGWCGRFRVLELGPLHPPAMPPPDPANSPGSALVPGEGLDPPGTLIVDSPGVERLIAVPERLPRPWQLLAHPVPAKRSWALPVDRVLDATGGGAVEARIAAFPGRIVVGESMTLLAALARRSAGATVLVSLPAGVDPHLARLVAERAAGDPAVCLF